MPTISSPERLEQILAARARVKPAIPIKPKLLEKVGVDWALVTEH
jgi:hypothetical protein